MVYGHGAGGMATASAVLGDVVAAAHHLSRGHDEAAPSDRQRVEVHPISELRTRVLPSLDVEDRPGVLARWPRCSAITMSRSGPWSRRAGGGGARLVFITHIAREGDVRATLATLAETGRRSRESAAMRSSGRERLTAGDLAWRGVIEEYREFLPVSAGHTGGDAARGRDAAARGPAAVGAGGATVLLKIEGANPTGSFKDRGMTMAISKAVEEGAKAVVCASTGNTSASAAAYSGPGRTDLRGAHPRGPHRPRQAGPGPHPRRAGPAGAGQLRPVALEIVRELPRTRRPVTVVNSVNPYRIEGQKTGAFEIVDQLGDAPEVHCIPVGNAGNITAYWRAICEYQQAGRSTRLPRMLGIPGRRGRPDRRRSSDRASPRPSPRRSGSGTRPAGTGRQRQPPSPVAGSPR